MHQLTLARPKNNQWGNYLIQQLVDSGKYQVRFEEFPPFQALGRRRGNLKPLKIDGSLVVIDDWDFAHPTSRLDAAFFDQNPFYRDIKLILKVQYSQLDKPSYPPIPIEPFLIFPRSTFKLGVFDWQPGGDLIAAFSGKPWRNRRAWIRQMQSMSSLHLVVGNPDPSVQEPYYDTLRRCTWGLILKGKGPGGKNRRETEYLSCGMPLALNYKPEYPFPFEPGIDYVYLEKPSDLNHLDQIDPVPFSRRSRFNYEKYFSSQGIVDTFERLTRKHLKTGSGDNLPGADGCTPQRSAFSLPPAGVMGGLSALFHLLAVTHFDLL